MKARLEQVAVQVGLNIDPVETANDNSLVVDGIEIIFDEGWHVGFSVLVPSYNREVPDDHDWNELLFLPEETPIDDVVIGVLQTLLVTKIKYWYEVERGV